MTATSSAALESTGPGSNVAHSTSNVSAHVAVRTRCAAGRSMNEDAVYLGDRQGTSWTVVEAPDSGVVAAVLEGRWIAAVVDGMGGHKAGGRAAREVVQGLATLGDPTRASVTERLRELSVLLAALGRADTALAGSGAAVTGLAHGSEGTFVFHVGDARAYRVRHAFLTQLTRDDSVAQAVADAGAQDASQPPWRVGRQLLQAIGGGTAAGEMSVHVQRVDVREPVRLLLCTDGLTDTLEIEVLERVVVGHARDAVCVALVDAALAAESQDDVTALVVDLAPAVPGARATSSVTGAGEAVHGLEPFPLRPGGPHE